MTHQHHDADFDRRAEELRREREHFEQHVTHHSELDRFDAKVRTESELNEIFRKERIARHIARCQKWRDHYDLFGPEWLRWDAWIGKLLDMLDGHVHLRVRILSSALRERPFPDTHPLGVVGTAYTYCPKCKKILSLDNEAAKLAMLDDGLDDAIIGSLP